MIVGECSLCEHACDLESSIEVRLLNCGHVIHSHCHSIYAEFHHNVCPRCEATVEVVVPLTRGDSADDHLNASALEAADDGSRRDELQQQIAAVEKEISTVRHELNATTERQTMLQQRYEAAYKTLLTKNKALATENREISRSLEANELEKENSALKEKINNLMVDKNLSDVPLSGGVDLTDKECLLDLFIAATGRAVRRKKLEIIQMEKLVNRHKQLVAGQSSSGSADDGTKDSCPPKASSTPSSSSSTACPAPGKENSRPNPLPDVRPHKIMPKKPLKNASMNDFIRKRSNFFSGS